MTYTELEELGVHSHRIMGILPDPKTNSFVSISDSGLLHVTSKEGKELQKVNPSGTKGKWALK